MIGWNVCFLQKLPYLLLRSSLTNCTNRNILVQLFKQTGSNISCRRQSNALSKTNGPIITMILLNDKSPKMFGNVQPQNSVVIRVCQIIHYIIYHKISTLYILLGSLCTKIALHSKRSSSLFCSLTISIIWFNQRIIIRNITAGEFLWFKFNGVNDVIFEPIVIHIKI